MVFREHVQAKTLCITTFRRLYPITIDFLKERTKSVTVFKHCDDFLTDQQFCSLRINLYCIIQCHILKIHPSACRLEFTHLLILQNNSLHNSGQVAGKMIGKIACIYIASAWPKTILCPGIRYSYILVQIFNKTSCPFCCMT